MIREAYPTLYPRFKSDPEIRARDIANGIGNGGYYSLRDRSISIYSYTGSVSIRDVLVVVGHESMHWILDVLEGVPATVDYDNIAERLESWFEPRKDGDYWYSPGCGSWNQWIIKNCRSYAETPKPL